MPVLFDDGIIQFNTVAGFRRNTIVLIRASPLHRNYFRHYMGFFHDYHDTIVDFMNFDQRPLEIVDSAKVIFGLHATMIKTEGEETRTYDAWFQSMTLDYQVEGERQYRVDVFNTACADLARQIEVFVRNGSGWVFDRLNYFDLHLAFYRHFQLRGYCTDPIPELPASLRNRRLGIIKLDSIPTGWNCFTQAVTISAFINKMIYSGIDQWYTDRKNCNRFKWWLKEMAARKFTMPDFNDALRSPNGVAINQIYEFENLNPQYFVTVLDYSNGAFHPLRTFKYSQYKDLEHPSMANMIYIFYHREHYFPIWSLDTLLSHERKRKFYYCPFCLGAVRTKETWECHIALCSGFPSHNVFMPKEGEVREFKSKKAIQEHPFVFYADTESILVPTNTSLSKSTTILNEHQPIMAAYYLAISEDLIEKLMARPRYALRIQYEVPELTTGSRYKVFVGENCMTEFLASLMNLSKRLYHLLKFFKQECEGDRNYQEQLRQQATTCSICNRPFADDPDEKDYERVIDHDHWTGKFRGIAHNACNRVVTRDRTYFPVFFHNFKGYDAHSLCRAAKFSECDDNIEVNCIAQSREKYISMTVKWQVDTGMIPAPPAKEGEEQAPPKTFQIKNELRFLDTLQFLQNSLDNLVKTHYDSAQEAGFPHTRANLRDSDDVFKLSLRKGVFPYCYMDAEEKFQETCLPPREAFTSDLNEGRECSEEEYEHAQTVWRALGCRNLGDYARHYLKTDVLLLCDVFEEFRRTAHTKFHLDPAFFYTIPSLAMEAALRETAVKLELLTDHEMYATFELGNRGGLTVCTSHYEGADNYYTNPERYKDPNEMSFYLFLFDANSLYPWAMVQPLPVGEFSWVPEEDFAKLFPADNLEAWPAWDDYYGYTLTVDLEYPQEIHDHTASYPLAPAHETITPDQLSLQTLYDWVGSAPCTRKLLSERKLLATQWDKINYTVHYRVLRLYIELGMRLVRIRSIIRYHQRPWLAPYINGNIERRKAAKTTFESNFHKLCNNSVFGKMQEQKRNRKNFSLTSSQKDTLYKISQPGYMGSLIFSEDLAGILMRSINLKLDQPMYVGTTILDLSKYLMFDFYYKRLLPLFPRRCDVIYTDTDSLLLRFMDKDVISRLQMLKQDYLDGSNLPADHPLHNRHNKGVLGLFKEEMDGKYIQRYVGLRPKMYALETADEGPCKKRAKGVKKGVVAAKLRFQDYYEVFTRKSKPIFQKQVTLASRDHVVRTQEQSKKALSLYDNKRYWWEQSGQSGPYGHYEAVSQHSDSRRERVQFLKDYCGVDLDKVKVRGKQSAPYQPPDHIASASTEMQCNFVNRAVRAVMQERKKRKKKLGVDLDDGDDASTAAAEEEEEMRGGKVSRQRQTSITDHFSKTI